MKLYVGNLAKETTEPQLRESFEKYGDIASLSIIMDKESGKSKGFAFVEMPSDDNANKAITGLNGKELFGNLVKVNEANKR
ncbi:MAG: RNA-binding protein [Candidatus Zixiibacteriota bacterium]